MATTVVAPQAQAAAVSGQGTWETTLQGRDLDGSAANGFEAYYDTVLNITWLADAGYAQTSGYDADGRLSWDAAKAWATNLNINGITGWRLPDVKPVNGSSFDDGYSPYGVTDVGFNITSTQSELAHLYYVTLGNKGFFDTSGQPQSVYGLSNTGPFSNVQTFTYWAGMAYASDNFLSWYFDTETGVQHYTEKYRELPVWAVRSGDVPAVPEPQAYAIALAGLAAVLAVRGRRYR